MKHQLQTIRDALNLALNSLLSEATKYEHPLIKQALTALSELERLAGEPSAWMWKHMKTGDVGCYFENPATVGIKVDHPSYEWTKLYAAPPAQQPQYEAGDMASAHNDGFRAGVASVAQQPQEPDWKHPKIQALISSDARNRIVIGLIWQILKNPDGDFSAMDMEYWDSIHDAVREAVIDAQQPHEIEVQCPVCNHKFYEWPGDQQPQADAVPPECDVRKIMLDVVPGIDGEGHEVYAKNVADVVKLLTEMGQRIEDLEGAQQAEAPPGYAVVPVEPTEAMHRAAVKTIQRCTGNADFPPAVWRAMIAAAQGEKP